jgi:hypothetical protein
MSASVDLHDEFGVAGGMIERMDEKTRRRRNLFDRE